ncbi:MAG: Lrp/AsnC family transcriptional regulator [Candidatus Hydrothermarchaeota archaeon]|jgi:DNA-binding Lrp family transcriptional regulator|nr:Lrp/AsnC family transcriptional regulator [Candidatus Hydrothermarchaeota archaeon]
MKTGVTDMVVAVCFVNTELGNEVKVRSRLSMFQGVRKVIELFGEYDFLLIIDAESLRQVNYIVNHVREIDGVKASKTIIGVESEAQ